MESSATGKRGYHHGDLRNALVTAAAELAAKGGPGSVTIRAAAREVGVTPTAAYRHFAGHEELLNATRERAMDLLADAMKSEVAARGTSDDPVVRALGKFGAIGRAYIGFARKEPGLFRTVFFAEGAKLPGEQDDVGSFQMLLDALDELVEVGYLSPADRPLTELTAWAQVHGVAMLLDGPLRDLPDDVRDQMIVRNMLVIAHGMRANGLTPVQEEALVAEFLPREG